MTPLAILFDLDNTLAHRGLSIASYARRFVAEFGARLPDATGDAACVEDVIGDGRAGAQVEMATLIGLLTDRDAKRL